MLILSLLAGFILLLVGGEILVKGSVAVAHRLNVPPLVIGIVLVGFGTSVPELVTCIEAAMKGAPDIAVGNVVGSNIANILLVAGAGAVFYPVVTSMDTFKREGGAVAIVTALLVAVAFIFGEVSKIVGILFLAVLTIYIWHTYYSAKLKPCDDDLEEEIEEIEKVAGKEITIVFGLILTFGGIAITVLGAKFLVSAAITIAEIFGVSEAIIGLTIVAIGTSLPELATAVIAGIRGHSDVSLGNILGSNIYNILGILGTTAVFYPMQIPETILNFDIWVMVGATVMLIIVAITHLKITRWEGGILLICYIVYLYLLYLKTQSAIL